MPNISQWLQQLEAEDAAALADPMIDLSEYDVQVLAIEISLYGLTNPVAISKVQEVLVANALGEKQVLRHMQDILRNPDFAALHTMAEAVIATYV
jgi:hypothetical protein